MAASSVCASGLRGLIGEDAIDGRLRRRGLVVVERGLGQEEVCVDERRVDRERPRRRGGCRRRVLVGQRAREAGVGRRPVGVGLERDAERLHRLARRVLLVKQRAPGGVDGRVVLQRAGRVAVERVRRSRLIERVGRARRAQQAVAGRRCRARRSPAAPASARRRSARPSSCCRRPSSSAASPSGFAFARRARAARARRRYLAAIDREAAEDRGGAGVAGAARPRHRLGLGTLAVRDRRARRAEERGSASLGPARPCAGCGWLSRLLRSQHLARACRRPLGPPADQDERAGARDDRPGRRRAARIVMG